MIPKVKITKTDKDNCRIEFGSVKEMSEFLKSGSNIIYTESRIAYSSDRTYMPGYYEIKKIHNIRQKSINLLMNKTTLRSANLDLILQLQ